jgi:hypothetical protein
MVLLQDLDEAESESYGGLLSAGTGTIQLKPLSRVYHTSGLYGKVRLGPSFRSE